MQSDREATDEELAARAREGDQEAFELLFERYSPRLRRQMRYRLSGLLRRKVDESDVVQMAYLEVHRGLGKFTDRGPGSFRAWLDQIVEHRFGNVLRRYVHTAKRRIEHEVSGPNVRRPRDLVGHNATPSVVAMAEESRRALEAAIAQLPDDYGEVLRLVEKEGLSMASAGERLGRSAEAAKKLYGRALAKLRALLHDERDHARE